MARKISMAALLVVVLTATQLLQSTYGRDHTVGDTTGWQVPSGNSEFYDNWAENNTFAIGDVLVFNFTTGEHNVAEVTEAAYEACTTTNPIFVNNTAPARITLNSTGDHYFICTVPGHCLGGQKLKVEVENGNSTTPTPGSSPTTPGVASPPPPSSASSLVGTLSIFFISIALVLVC